MSPKLPSMSISRRRFVQTSALAATAAYASPVAAQRGGQGGPATPVPDSIRALKPFPGKAAPITDQERLGRIEKARRLMAEQDIGAIVLETGTSMTYFANVRWGLERAAVPARDPAEGRAGVCLPRLRGSARERAHDVHEGRPGLAGRRRLGCDGPGHPQGSRRVDRRRSASKSASASSSPTASRRRRRPRRSSSATPVTAGCRMIKSATEIALMQRANDITIEAFRAALTTLREGMTQIELGRNIRAAFDALGGPGGSALIGFGKYSAFPARQHHAAGDPRRRHRPHRRRLHDRGLSIRHHADDGLRQADPAAD